MPLGHTKLFEFGRFRVDAGQRLLLRDGEVFPLAPKAFDTLLALVESQGAVLEKDDLLKKVWPDTFVEEGRTRAGTGSPISRQSLRGAIGLWFR